jgi:hypothetical protein
MNGWNRLFVVVAVLWALVVPFYLVADHNKPVEQIFSMCSEVAYQIYGTASSPRLDMDRYHVETAKCSQDLVRDLIGVPELLGAMIGLGSWQAGLVASSSFLWLYYGLLAGVSDAWCIGLALGSGDEIQAPARPTDDARQHAGARMIMPIEKEPSHGGYVA